MVLVVLTGSKAKKIHLSLKERGEHEELAVVFAGRGDDQIDLDLALIHKVSRTLGRITVRGVLRDRATATVRGLIKIKKRAQRSQDFFEGRVLVLGEEARAEIFPYLEIEADDVSASHAAAVSPPSPEELFYLRSRGISARRAEELLVSGFLRSGFALAGDNQIESKVRKAEEYLK